MLKCCPSSPSLRGLLPEIRCDTKGFVLSLIYRALKFLDQPQSLWYNIPFKGLEHKRIFKDVAVQSTVWSLTAALSVPQTNYMKGTNSWEDVGHGSRPAKKHAQDRDTRFAPLSVPCNLNIGWKCTKDPCIMSLQFSQNLRRLDTKCDDFWDRDSVLPAILGAESIGLILTLSPIIMSKLNPSRSYTQTLSRSVALNNEALVAERTGDLTGAERLHREAIALKESILGNEDPTTALSYNALGELYLKMHKLDEAERYLSKAVQIRNARGTLFDAAVSRENMGQLQEARGNLGLAKECRLAGAPDKMACGYYQCPGQIFTLSQLKACGKCKSVYYCSSGCQKNDWNTRHKAFCKLGVAA